LDIELEGFSSLRDLKKIVSEYPKLKIILFTNAAEKGYTQTAQKIGAVANVSKKSSLASLEKTLLDVAHETNHLKKINATAVQEKKSERLFKKLSNREIEVLRYLSNGKKNKEIAHLLAIDEKTISTYKLRLLTKLNVTNLVDLLQKAKDLEII
jgi:DNA-binding NarL/FixJ family response regulator